MSWANEQFWRDLEESLSHMMSEHPELNTCKSCLDCTHKIYDEEVGQSFCDLTGLYMEEIYGNQR